MPRATENYSKAAWCRYSCEKQQRIRCFSCCLLCVSRTTLLASHQQLRAELGQGYVMLAKGALHWVCSLETCGGRKHTYGSGWSLFRRLLESQSPSNSVDLPKPESRAHSFQSICARTRSALGHQPVQEQRMRESVAVQEGPCVLDTHSG